MAALPVSYTHTQMALEMGMDEEQIKELLGAG